MNTRLLQMAKLTFIWPIILLLFAGCASVPASRAEGETSQEARSAMKAVVSSISGKELNDKEMTDLGKQIRNDDQAQSAVRSIADSLTGSVRTIKYCPIDGKRYSAHLIMCPDHKSELENLE